MDGSVGLGYKLKRVHFSTGRVHFCWTYKNTTIIKNKVHGWSLWLTNILYLALAFQKYMDSPCGLHFLTHLVPNFCQKYIDGPCGLHFVTTHLVPNLDLLKPLDLLAGD
ncbi:hypothetical protein Hanom_Chr12g01144131 [Helianthus anomalus]